MLFDLSCDPGETNILAAENPAVVEELALLAEAYRKELGDSLSGRAGIGLRPVG